MNKTEYVLTVTEAFGITKIQPITVIEFLLKLLQKPKKSESVRITGFGTYEVAKRATRTGRNPATGKEIKIAASSRFYS